MKIGIACGGTGGHIFPGLATAEVMRARGHEVTLWMGGKDIEKKALAGWPGKAITIASMGLPARLAPPDVLLAMGGYASLAPVLAARALAIPVILHEANVIPGKANRFLSRFAGAFALGFKETANNIAHRNMIYTGIPLRRPVTKETVADWDILKPDAFTILAMGGSRGARALNDMVIKAVTSLHTSGKSVQVIHLTGTEDEAAAREAYLDAGVTSLVFAFLQGMDPAFRRSALAICRAGGSTCAELAKFGLPALLIPYPHAASNHQMANARAMENAGAADVIEESKCSAVSLAEYISGVMANREKLDKMRLAALGRADQDAAGALADLVLETGRRS
jgi:UDP-N-acetylglucosamine--N-acetylmuramyl-(pentapeptide) pyrophosphoryl-undecaprenol N-acetylglucosamine transferase